MSCSKCHRVVKARGLCFSHWREVRWAEVPGLKEQEIAVRRRRNKGEKIGKTPERIDPDLFWDWVKKELKIEGVKK